MWRTVLGVCFGIALPVCLSGAGDRGTGGNFFFFFFFSPRAVADPRAGFAGFPDRGPTSRVAASAAKIILVYE